MEHLCFGQLQQDKSHPWDSLWPPPQLVSVSALPVVQNQPHEGSRTLAMMSQLRKFSPSGGPLEGAQRVTRNGWADGLFKGILQHPSSPPHAGAFLSRGRPSHPWGNVNKYFTNPSFLNPHTILTLRNKKQKSTNVQMNYASFNFSCLSELINSLWINDVPWCFGADVVIEIPVYL